VVNIAVGVYVDGSGVSVGVKVDVDGIGFRVDAAEICSEVAVGGTDTSVISAVPQAASSNA
jgi:hypothetical protein